MHFCRIYCAVYDGWGLLVALFNVNGLRFVLFVVLMCILYSWIIHNVYLTYIHPYFVYRICRSISRSSSTITTRTRRGVRLMYRMCCIIIQRGSKYNTSRHVKYSTTMASKRASYTAALKLKVIETAEKCGNRAARREYFVNKKLVRDWRKKKAELEALPRGKRSLTNVSW